MLVPRGQASVSTAAGQTLALPSRQPECSGIKVMSGEVTACFLDGNGVRQCRGLRAGDEFVASKLGAANSESNPFKATMTALLKGDGQVVAGQTRTGTRVPGMPYGSVVALAGSVPVSPELALGSSATGSLAVRAIGEPTMTYTWPLTPTTTSIPTDRLQPGREYAWTLTADKIRRTGQFRLASEDERMRVRTAIQGLGQAAGTDESGRAILAAELLSEGGFAYEAARTLEGLALGR